VSVPGCTGDLRGTKTPPGPARFGFLSAAVRQAQSPHRRRPAAGGQPQTGKHHHRHLPL